MTCWDDRPRWAANADLTVYWPDVRPCWEEERRMELLTNKWVALTAIAVVLAFGSCATMREYREDRWRTECVRGGGEIRHEFLGAEECRRP